MNEMEENEELFEGDLEELEIDDEIKLGEDDKKKKRNIFFLKIYQGRDGQLDGEQLMHCTLHTIFLKKFCWTCHWIKGEARNKSRSGRITPRSGEIRNRNYDRFLERHLDTV